MPVARTKRADERVGQWTCGGHELDPLAGVARAAAGDHLGHARHVEVRCVEELRQRVGLAEACSLRAVAGKAQVVAAGKRRESLEEEILRASAETSALVRHREAAARTEHT